MSKKNMEQTQLETIKGGMPKWWLNDSSVNVSYTTGCKQCTYTLPDLDDLSRAADVAPIDIPSIPAACDNLS